MTELAGNKPGNNRTALWAAWDAARGERVGPWHTMAGVDAVCGWSPPMAFVAAPPPAEPRCEGCLARA